MWVNLSIAMAVKQKLVTMTLMAYKKATFEISPKSQIMGREKILAHNYLHQNNRELAISGCNNLGMIPTPRLSRSRDNRELRLKLERFGCNKFFGLILIATLVSVVHKKALLEK
uniref:Uncharacterized protein n=1 Tax=Romanomermis culicivorax TaxID=13658 RepID=A0A915IRS8_ROMCU